MRMYKIVVGGVSVLPLGDNTTLKLKPRQEVLKESLLRCGVFGRKHRHQV